MLNAHGAHVMLMIFLYVHFFRYVLSFMIFTMMLILNSTFYDANVSNEDLEVHDFHYADDNYDIHEDILSKIMNHD